MGESNDGAGKSPAQVMERSFAFGLGSTDTVMEPGHSDLEINDGGQGSNEKSDGRSDPPQDTFRYAVSDEEPMSDLTDLRVGNGSYADEEPFGHKRTISLSDRIGTIAAKPGAILDTGREFIKDKGDKLASRLITRRNIGLVAVGAALTEFGRRRIAKYWQESRHKITPQAFIDKARAKASDLPFRK